MGKNIIEANKLSTRIDNFNEKMKYSIELIDEILKKIDLVTIDENSLAYHTSMSYMELIASIEKIITDNDKMKRLVELKGSELDNLKSETEEE